MACHDAWRANEKRFHKSCEETKKILVEGEHLKPKNSKLKSKFVRLTLVDDEYTDICVDRRAVIAVAALNKDVYDIDCVQLCLKTD